MLAPPAGAAVIRPAGGCSSAPPFWTAARVAEYTQVLTSRVNSTVYSFEPTGWLTLSRAFPAILAPPELMAALRAVPAGPAGPAGPAAPAGPGLPRRLGRALGGGWRRVMARAPVSVLGSPPPRVSLP